MRFYPTSSSSTNPGTSAQNANDRQIESISTTSSSSSNASASPPRSRYGRPVKRPVPFTPPSQDKVRRKRGKILEDGQVDEEKIGEYEMVDPVNLEDLPGSPTENVNSTQNMLESLNQIEVMEQVAPLVQLCSDINQPGFRCPFTECKGK